MGQESQCRFWTTFGELLCVKSWSHWNVVEPKVISKNHNHFTFWWRIRAGDPDVWRNSAVTVLQCQVLCHRQRFLADVRQVSVLPWSRVLQRPSCLNSFSSAQVVLNSRCCPSGPETGSRCLSAGAKWASATGARDWATSSTSSSTPPSTKAPQTMTSTSSTRTIPGPTVAQRSDPLEPSSTWPSVLTGETPLAWIRSLYNDSVFVVQTPLIWNVKINNYFDLSLSLALLYSLTWLWSVITSLELVCH